MNLLALNERVLPPLYARWISEALQAPLPEERRSTCRDCAMCEKPSQPKSLLDLHFQPSLKCCTFHPELPNFLVGRALGAGGAPAERLAAMIEAPMSASPLGLRSSAAYKALAASSGKSGFGRLEGLLCPHFDASADDGRGGCGIWQHREATCATYFCKHDRGAVGYLFWRELQRLLGYVERGLARWAMVESGLEASALRVLYPPPGDIEAPPMTAAELAQAWGGWREKKAAYFLACAQRVDALSWADVREIVGPELPIFERLVQQAFVQLMRPTVPGKLQPGAVRAAPVGPDVVRVQGYRQTDLVDLPSPVLGVLHYFSAMPTAQALQVIQEEEGLPMSEATLLRLVDFQLLVSRA